MCVEISNDSSTTTEGLVPSPVAGVMTDHMDNRNNDITAPFVTNMSMFADADLMTGANFAAGGVAGQQRRYDPNAPAPFTSVIDMTLWLEDVGQ